MRHLLLLSAGVLVSAQVFDHRLDGYRNALAEATIADLLDVGKNSRGFLYYMAGDRLAQDRFQRFVQILDSARMDKQAGAGTLVSKPSVTAVLSAAIETGALNETTLRGDPVGIARMLLGDEPFPFCESGAQSCDTRIVKALNGVSFSVSAEPTATSTRIAAFSVRYGLYNHRNPNYRDYRTAYGKAIESRRVELVAAAGTALAKFEPLMTQLASTPAYLAWFIQARDDLTGLPAGTSVADFQNRFAGHLDDLIAILKVLNPHVEDDAIQALEALDVYFATRKQVLADVNNGSAIVTLEYTHSSPLGGPRLSNFRLIYSCQPSDRVLITLNAATTRGRDVQAAAEIDLAMRQLGSLGSPTFSAASYYRYQRGPAAGSTIIGELKLTFPMKTSGVSVPFAVTWANGSVTAHFGLAFDLDVLLSKAK